MPYICHFEGLKIIIQKKLSTQKIKKGFPSVFKRKTIWKRINIINTLLSTTEFLLFLKDLFNFKLKTDLKRESETEKVRAEREKRSSIHRFSSQTAARA